MPLLEVEGICKEYTGGVKALLDLDFSLEEGEIHGVLGENGAGKTTLMNVLYGMTQPDSGIIRMRGKRVAIRSPAQAIRLGIGMVHQHFMLVPSLTVAENLMLGTKPALFGFWSPKRIRGLVNDLSGKFKLDVEPDALVERLPVGTRQRVELLKVLIRGAKLLILDEPTAVLTPDETGTLFGTLRSMKEQGYSIIFITHKLKEIMEVADRVTVLRKGRRVCTRKTSECTEQELASLMVGSHSQLGRRQTSSSHKGNVLLETRKLGLRSPEGRLLLHDIDLSLWEHEILGIAGVDGNGQLELTEILFGLRPRFEGSVSILGEEAARPSPKWLIDHRVARIPQDRHAMGIVLDMSVKENLMLEGYRSGKLSTCGVLRAQPAAEFSRQLAKEYDIRIASVQDPIRTLSGGNQQKVILARALSNNPKIVIAANPTRGLDVGATLFIHRTLLALREKGCGILLISTDLDEILTLSDRIAVMYRGRIIGVVDNSEVERWKIGQMMAGISLN